MLQRVMLASILFLLGLFFIGSVNASGRDDVDAASAQVTASGVQCKLVLEPKLHFVFSGLRGSTSLAGKELSKWRVMVDRPGATGQQPSVLGSFISDGDQVRFEPRFTLQPGLRYKVQLPGPPEESVVLEIPKKTADSQPRKVAAIYPSGDVLPENVLKFYIHFAQPMRRGSAYERIELLVDGKPLESPFLELGEELWDREQRRFTLFVHPGRIKRGVKPNMDSGPAMKAGTQYTLRIASDWQTASGEPLERAFEKKFRVTWPDREQPQPGNWQIEIPAPDTRQPIGLVFDEPLDHALLQHMFRVVALDGTAVEGDIVASDSHDRWALKPKEPWKPGTYQIIVDTALEDLCGNSIARPFEVQLKADSAAQENPGQAIAIEFEVGR